MNKKILIGVLLVFVIFIWVKLTMDFFKYKEADALPLVIETTSAPQQIIETASFDYELNMNYTDPFLKQVRNQTVRKPSRVRTPKPKVEKELPKVTVKWPKVEYLGDISSVSGTQISVILKVNGEESILHEGEANGQVSLVSLHSDSLVISYMNELKTLLK